MIVLDISLPTGYYCIYYCLLFNCSLCIFNVVSVPRWNKTILRARCGLYANNSTSVGKMAPYDPEAPSEDGKEKMASKTHTARVMSEAEKDLVRARTTAKMVFTKKANMFKERVVQNDHIETLKHLYNEVEERYKTLESRNIELVDFYIDNDFNNDFIQTALAFTNQSETIKCELHSQLMGMTIGEGKPEDASGAKANLKLKFEPLKYPRFEGDIRLFPGFLDDVNNMIVPQYNNSESASILKQCLGVEPAKVVRNRDKDFKELMDLLKAEYGDPRKIVESVVQDLKRLSPVADGDTVGFIKMVQVVDTCYVDLCKVDLQSEISNVNIVNSIQELLPSEPYKRWVRLSRSIEDKTELFPTLLKFLLEEKKDLEFASSCRESVGFKVHTYMAPEPEFADILKKMQEEQNSTRELVQQQTNLVQQLCSKLNSMEKSTPRPSVGRQWCVVHNVKFHDTPACGKLRSMSPSERHAVMVSNNCCFLCLGGKHPFDTCNKPLCNVRINGVMCGQRHHSLLHDHFVPSLGQHSSSTFSFSSRANVLLESMIAFSFRTPIQILWDSGAQGSLITHRKAQELGARSFNVSGPMEGVGGMKKWVNSKVYFVTLHDRRGNAFELQCLGMDEVAGPIAEFDVKQLLGVFPEPYVNAMVRPHGYCDMLIGNDYIELHPMVFMAVGKLQLMSSTFGYSVRGVPPTGMIVKPYSNSSSYNNVSFDLQIDPLKQSIEKFFQIESGGVESPALADKDSLEWEKDLIESGLRYDEVGKVWVASYPWVQDPDLLPNNYTAIYGRLRSTEKSLIANHSLAQAYQREMEDMVSRGVARKLSKAELAAYKGPVHYISHFGISKPSSSSTPLRIVYDPTTKFMGYKLNSFWAKGPNTVQNLFSVMIRFRRDAVGIVGDISKMYHSVLLEAKEQHVHRFLWRDLDLDRSPDHYVLCSVTFGDVCSGILATTAMRFTAMMQRTHYPHVLDIIEKDTYVDDILPNADSLESAAKLTADVDTVLAEGNFRVKKWIMSGDNLASNVSVDMSKEIGQKVLGMLWIPTEDVFKFIVKLNFSPKFKGVRCGPNIRKAECESSFPVVLTRRMIVSQLAASFDPLGLILPYTVLSKYMLRSLLVKSDVKDNRAVDWDEPLCGEVVNAWKGYFAGLFDIESLSFPRSVKVNGSIEDPVLVIFSDGSQTMYGCCAYVRWRAADGSYMSRLIAAKNKMGPKRQITVPQSELCGAVLGVRLRCTIVERMGIRFSEVIHIVDSTIVFSQTQKESTAFKMFVAVRISEIHEGSNPEEWLWVDTSNNVADMVTKPCAVGELASGGRWQDGPAFLALEKSEWPTSRPVHGIAHEGVPDLKVLVSSFTTVSNERLFGLDISRFSSFTKLVRVLARVVAAIRQKSFKYVSQGVSSDDFKEAERLIIIDLQKDLGDWANNYKSLGPYESEGIVFVGGRIKNWLKTNWNREGYALLPSDSPVSKLLIQEAHYENHDGVETTLCKLLSKFWIPKSRKMIKAIKGKCVRCRFLEKKVAGQCMGQVSDTRMKPTPIWYHCSTDIFGPFTVRDSVKRRTFGKCYGVIFTCLSSRAVHLELVENCSTEAFVNAVRRFSSLRGFPLSMHSDNGTQLIAANKELIAISKGLDVSEIKGFGDKNKMQWSFNRASDAPWLNGACESLIKSVKVSIQKAINDNVLTFPEFQTVLYEVANIVNSRPIGVKPGNDISRGTYLSPNCLLLGRNDRHAPHGVYDETASPRARLKFIQSLVSSFWKRWQIDYFPSLLIQKKWHTKQRNVTVGDVVLVQDSNAVRGHWRMGEVVSVIPGRDTMIRDVRIRYKLTNDDTSYKGSKDRFMNRSVHRLVVLLPAEER